MNIESPLAAAVPPDGGNELARLPASWQAAADNRERTPRRDSEQVAKFTAWRR